VPLRRGAHVPRDAGVARARRDGLGLRAVRGANRLTERRRAPTDSQGTTDTKHQHHPLPSGEIHCVSVEAAEAEYGELQALGEFDRKTSSWLATPPEVRALGGALFGDRRYGRVFTYHNGAQSYFAARGFRGLRRV
jgi:hypothetical protein